MIRRYANYGKSRAKVFFIHKRSVLMAAVVATVRVLLIPVAIWALIVQRYDILLVAVGLPLAHQLYRFFKSSWQINDISVSSFLLDVVLSYTLYFFFVSRFLFLLFSPGARRKLYGP